MKGMDAGRSGQTTVTTAGTEVALGSGHVGGPLMVKALSSNTGSMYVGNNGAGAVASTSGFELQAGESVIFDDVGDLNTILVDSAVNGEKVCWIAL